jgi:hypothetical protein
MCHLTRVGMANLLIEALPKGETFCDVDGVAFWKVRFLIIFKNYYNDGARKVKWSQQ